MFNRGVNRCVAVSLGGGGLAWSGVSRNCSRFDLLMAFGRCAISWLLRDFFSLSQSVRARSETEMQLPGY